MLFVHITSRCASKVFLISKAQLKTANKQYTTIDNDYEMTFNNETTVEPCNEEQDDTIPRISVSLIPLSELLNKNANDVVGE
jgi:replication factor A1